MVMKKVGLEEKKMSFKAKGLLAYLLSKPDNWTANISHLSKVGPDGNTAIETGLKELEDNYYLHRIKERNKKGQFEWESIVTEIPTKSPQPENPDMDNPDMEKPELDNRPLISNEVVSNDLISNEKETKGTFDRKKEDNGFYSYPEGFEKLWNIYPRKINKKIAWQKWKNRMNDGIDNSLLLKAIKIYAEECKIHDTEERYMKYPQTFLGSGGYWQEYTESKGNKKSQMSAEERRNKILEAQKRRFKKDD